MKFVNNKGLQEVIRNLHTTRSFAGSLPLSKMRNCKLKNNSFSIHFMILLANDSTKKAKNSKGIGIVILL